MKLMDKSVFAFAVFAVFSASAANTWYVDDDNYNADYPDAAAYIAAGLDGTCVEKAFGTIQIAIDKAQSDDTIYGRILPMMEIHVSDGKTRGFSFILLTVRIKRLSSGVNLMEALV